MVDFKSILIYCDGACSGNPGRGGWGVIVVDPAGQILELGGEAQFTTNNQMELQAVMEGFAAIQGMAGDVHILTDSVYVIRGITQWIWGWRKKGWKTAEGADVANRDYWEALSAQVTARKKVGQVHWKYVRGHVGIPGNERVDEIAVAFSKGSHVDLYRGSLLKYSVAVHDIPENTELPEMKPKGAAKPKALSYLSLIGGDVVRHATWAECERRIKGRSGAKFKKAMSESEELAILESWGVGPGSIKK